MFLHYNGYGNGAVVSRDVVERRRRRAARLEASTSCAFRGHKAPLPKSSLYLNSPFLWIKNSELTHESRRQEKHLTKGSFSDLDHNIRGDEDFMFAAVLHAMKPM